MIVRGVLWQIPRNHLECLTSKYPPNKLTDAIELDASWAVSVPNWAIPENIHTSPMDDIGNPVVSAR